MSRNHGSPRKKLRETVRRMKRMDEERAARERRQRRQQDHLREVARVE